MYNIHKPVNLSVTCLDLEGMSWKIQSKYSHNIILQYID